MLKVDENMAQVVGNVNTDIVIFETENENEIEALATIQNIHDKYLRCFEKYEETGDEFYDRMNEKYFHIFKSSLKMFNLLTGTELQSYMFI